MNIFRLTARRKLASVALAALVAGGFYAGGLHRSDAADAAFSAGQQTQIETIVHDYILKNPQVLMEAVAKYQDGQSQRDADTFKKKIGTYHDFMTSASSASAGNPKGDVTVVEFFDYNCGYCRHAIDDVTKLIDQDKNVKIIFKDYPILAESSGDAARYALAAGKQGKYWEFHQKLMRFNGNKDEAAFKQIAGELSLNFDQLKKDADSKEVRATIEQNTTVARDLGINGTPAFIFGDTLVPGYLSVDNMKDIVAKIRKEKS